MQAPSNATVGKGGGRPLVGSTPQHKYSLPTNSDIIEGPSVVSKIALARRSAIQVASLIRNEQQMDTNIINYISKQQTATTCRVSPASVRVKNKKLFLENIRFQKHYMPILSFFFTSFGPSTTSRRWQHFAAFTETDYFKKSDVNAVSILSPGHFKEVLQSCIENVLGGNIQKSRATPALGSTKPVLSLGHEVDFNAIRTQALRPEVAASPSANATLNDLRARTIGAVGTVLRTSVRNTPFGLGSAYGRPECTLEECAAKFRHSSIGGSMGGSTTHQTAQPPRWLPTAFGGAATLTRAQRKARRVRASAQQWCARKTHKALPLRNSVVASSHKYPAPMALGRTWVANKVLTPCTSIEADGKNRHFQICHGVAKWRLRHSPPSCGHATREGNQNKHAAHRNGATPPFVSNAGIRINCNKRDILEKLAEKGFVIKKGNKFRPTSYKPALELPLPHIVQAIQRIFQGIAHYYGFADNYWVMNSLFQHYGRICCAATIAHKTRSTLGKVLKKYGPNIEVPIPGTNVRPVRE